LLWSIEGICKSNCDISNLTCKPGCAFNTFFENTQHCELKKGNGLVPESSPGYTSWSKTKQADKVSNILTSQECMDFCQQDDGEIQNICARSLEEHCTNADNIETDECKIWCKENLSQCSTHMETWCDNKYTNPICACYLPQQSYIDIRNKAIAKGVTVFNVDEPPKRGCVNDLCATSEYKPQLVIDEHCSNICINTVDITNNGGSIGDVDVNLSNECTFIADDTQGSSLSDSDTSCDFRSDCTDSDKPVCIDGVCVECSLQSDCNNSDKPVCSSNICVECSLQSDCNNSDKPVCSSNICVECTVKDDCPNDSTCNNSNLCIDENGVEVGVGGKNETEIYEEWWFILFVIIMPICIIIGTIIYFKYFKAGRAAGRAAGSAKRVG